VKPLCEDTECPLVVGINNRSTMSIWPDTVSGKVNSKIQWRDTNGKSLLCIQTSVAVSAYEPVPLNKTLVPLYRYVFEDKHHHDNPPAPKPQPPAPVPHHSDKPAPKPHHSDKPTHPSYSPIRPPRKTTGGTTGSGTGTTGSGTTGSGTTGSGTTGSGTTGSGSTTTGTNPSNTGTTININIKNIIKGFLRGMTQSDDDSGTTSSSTTGSSGEPSSYKTYNLRKHRKNYKL
jgi:hypothetical protein